MLVATWVSDWRAFGTQKALAVVASALPNSSESALACLQVKSLSGMKDTVALTA